MTAEIKNSIRRKRRDGMSYLQISREIGISQNTIKSFCQRNNLGNKPKVKYEKLTTCLHCGKQINENVSHKPRRFCSDLCRLTWWKNHHDEMNKRAYYSIICTGCGKEFDVYGNEHRKFCTHECYINYRFKGGDSHDKAAV